MARVFYKDTDGEWWCSACGGKGWCYCFNAAWPDPICDCGEPAWACKCEEEDLMLGIGNKAVHDG